MHITDMRKLVTKHPEVHKQVVKGNHAVSRSSKPFSQVWTDMGQSINADSKLKGGIIGFFENPDALNRWLITRPERAAVTTAVKEMFGDHPYSDTHKRLLRNPYFVIKGMFKGFQLVSQAIYSVTLLKTIQSY